MRGATSVTRHARRNWLYFNPRSSCEERPLYFLPMERARNFNPRSSCEERHRTRGAGMVDRRISIHAPHARSDGVGASEDLLRQHFNPRSSCEERRYSMKESNDSTSFQSTLLMRGATALRHCVQLCVMNAFQSTLLMRGAT